MTNSFLDRDRVEFLAMRDEIGRIAVPAWPRQAKELRLIEVPTDWPRFSTLNHRTRAEQIRACARAGRPDLFTSDPLGPDAQDAQYQILSNQDGFAELKADLLERGQQDPAIVTADGVLINGNRRTAALRSLHGDDRHLKAAYVRCLVLPEDASPKEITDLEAELQVARDFKQEYSWINEAMLIEELYVRDGRDWDRVSAQMHRKGTELRTTYEKLQQVHQLVALSSGTRHHVDFDANESAFDELAKHIRNKAAGEVSSVRSAYFLGTLAGVQYRKLRHLRRDDAAQLVLNELLGAASLAPVLEAIDLTGADNSDELDELIGDPQPHNRLESVVTFLASKRPEESIELASGDSVLVNDVLETVNSVVCAAADEALEDSRDRTNVGEPVKQLESALASLERAARALPRARAFDEWDEAIFIATLSEVDRVANELRAAK